MRLKQVVLPAPFGPINAWMLPRRTRRSTSRTAEKPANSLLNPRVSRMYSSANHISPTIAAGTRAWPICLPGKLSYDPLGSRVRAAASVREYAVNGRPYASRKRRSGAERAAEDSTLVQLLGHKDWLSPTFSALAGAEPRQALINGVSMPSGGFIEYLPVTAIMMKNFQNGSKLWNSRAPIHRSSDRSSSGTC